MAFARPTIVACATISTISGSRKPAARSRDRSAPAISALDATPSANLSAASGPAIGRVRRPCVPHRLVAEAGRLAEGRESGHTVSAAIRLGDCKGNLIAKALIKPTLVESFLHGEITVEHRRRARHDP